MRRTARSCRLLSAAGVLLAAGSLVMRAQDGPPQDPGIPERGVARMSVASGEVSVRRGDSGDWVAAVVNAPLMVEDRIATGTGSRAEVQFDGANLIRIGAHAEVRLAQLESSHYNLQLAHGTVTFRVLRDSPVQVELDTPTVSVRPAEVGVYRIYVQEDGQTEITIRLGSAEIFTPKGSQHLEVGQTMMARGNPADPEFRIVGAIAFDEWDSWNEQRDHELESSPSYNNVPPDVYGTEELDNRGRWVQDPSYGDVWAPTVGPDWAPYQNGRWVWEDYYGWTWVSYDPWGWAPFHYGRWFFAPRVGWCWYPGGFGHHYWSPALVAFFGFGPGVGVGFGFGNVGWVALAPFEPLYAWWGHGFYAGFRSPGFYGRGVNVTNVNIGNVYRNARVTNAVASVPAGDFHQGRFGNIARASGAQIREAGLVRGQLPVAPSAASLRFSNRTVASVPRSSDNARFFSHSSPAAVRRVPFSEQQRAMQQWTRPPSSVTAHSAAIGGGGASSPVARPTAPATASGAWRPVSPAPSAAPATGGNTGSGWQRFGDPRPASSGTSRSYPGAWNAPRPAQSQPNAPQYRPTTATGPSGSGSQQSVRVAPPVVRERPASGNAPAKQQPAHSSSTGSSGHASSSGGHGGSHR